MTNIFRVAFIIYYNHFCFRRQIIVAAAAAADFSRLYATSCISVTHKYRISSAYTYVRTDFFSFFRFYNLSFEWSRRRMQMSATHPERKMSWMYSSTTIHGLYVSISAAERCHAMTTRIVAGNSLICPPRVGQHRYRWLTSKHTNIQWLGDFSEICERDCVRWRSRDACKCSGAGRFAIHPIDQFEGR